MADRALSVGGAWQRDGILRRDDPSLPARPSLGVALSIDSSTSSRYDRLSICGAYLYYTSLLYSARTTILVYVHETVGSVGVIILLFFLVSG